jgi:integrase
VQILEANTDPRDQVALRLLLFFGIRKGALRRIQLDHFDAEKRTVTITTKGGKIQTLQIVDDTVWKLFDETPRARHELPATEARHTPPRTADTEAAATLETTLASCTTLLADAAADEQCAQELAAVLDSLKIADARLAIAVQAAATQTRVDLEQAIGEHGCHLWWYRCLAKGGIVAEGTTAGRRMHGARHTAIQRVLDKTGNLKAAQDLAGHANIATTGDTYTDWSPQQQADTMRQVLA